MGENLHESSLEGKIKIKVDGDNITFFYPPDPDYVRTIVIDGVEIRIKGRKEDASIIQQYLESIFEVALRDR
jgi:hypothetical protein